MDDDIRSIGALARESRLSVSALRFYDSAGVLRPARVDRVTGYRWYATDQVAQARLIAALRQVSMPLTDICEVLAVRHDPIAARHLIDQHSQRLEDSLTDARRQLRLARDLLDQQEKLMTTLTVLGSDLTDALPAVRFAVSSDPELPELGGVLFDFDGGTLRLVASDRYRLAVATVHAWNQHGPAVQVIAPLSLVDGHGRGTWRGDLATSRPACADDRLRSRGRDRRSVPELPAATADNSRPSGHDHYGGPAAPSDRRPDAHHDTGTEQHAARGQRRATRRRHDRRARVRPSRRRRVQPRVPARSDRRRRGRPARPRP
ncbi:MAG: hypothetical protein DLM59_17735 [Pseudonocardiales bacterium]|nr:MAG: hypothetical protein DLM59_17735 [Pseudonocardiales bacterium]